MKRIVAVLAAGFFAVITCGAQNSTDLSNYRQEGIASWYGTEFDGRPTASGETFNSTLYTAAHPTLPFGTLLTVTNMNNGRKVNVRVNDRGPFVSSRIIDLSQAAAQMLDMVSSGTAPVVVEIMKSESTYSQVPSYQADTSSSAVSQGGYSSATSQIYAPYPSYQTTQPTVQTPVYPSVQSGEPVVVQVQPPQQQITQYFQQPTSPQQQVQQPVQQSPRQTTTQPVQPVQQVLPVQQVIQPVQPIVQPITPQQPSQPTVQTTVPAPAIQATQPVQINIPIEVRPVVSSEPIVIPVPMAESPAPAEAGTAATVPTVPTVPPIPTAPVQTTTAPAATPSVTVTMVPTVPAPSATAVSPASTVVVKPNTMYRIQVGSYREVRNALAAAERLTNAGLS
ncbi:MAG: septal ring lytic transglycosylase RlpA family protein, partial [Treponema sp.]|nr:septal ring lytic transglycosylase RlpA family protein [Treponema sp.]